MGPWRPVEDVGDILGARETVDLDATELKSEWLAGFPKMLPG